MRLDDTDIYIKEHISGMTMQSMADHLGVAKSTVSRRVKAMREAGEIETIDRRAIERMAQQGRNDLESCAIDNADRLKKLDAIKTVLEDEMARSGGSNLARLSSEYRKLIEEMANISTSLELANGSCKRVGMLTRRQIEVKVVGEFFGKTVDYETCREIVDAVLDFLHDSDFIFYTRARGA